MQSPVGGCALGQPSPLEIKTAAGEAADRWPDDSPAAAVERLVER